MAPHPANVSHPQREYTRQCRWPIPGNHYLFRVLWYERWEDAEKSGFGFLQAKVQTRDCRHVSS